MATDTTTSADASRPPPVMLIGVSGATWSVIDAMLAEGELPNLRALMRAGSWGVVDSVKVAGDAHYRPQTAWPSVFTGKRPERHGITRYYHTSEKLTSACLWDHFAARGLSAGLYSVPVLWPPPELDGFVVPVMYARDGRAWPEELSELGAFYRRQQDSKLRPSTWQIVRRSMRFLPILFGGGRDLRTPLRMLASAARLAVERDPEKRSLILRHAKLDFGTAMFLSLRARFVPHLSILTIFELDYISHRYWRYHEPERFPDRLTDVAPELSRAVRDAYAHVDRCVGALVDSLPAERVVAVVSEHGMGAEVPSGEVGRWRYMISASKARTLAGIGTDVAAIPIARWVVFRKRGGGALDDRVGRALRRLTVLETDRPLFSVHPNGREEVVVKLDLPRPVYGGMDDIGELHLSVPGVGVVPIGCVLQRAGPTRSAMHCKEGVFILAGPGIRAGHRIVGASITDVLPTLLVAAGLEPPSDLDGTAMDVFVGRRAGAAASAVGRTS